MSNKDNHLIIAIHITDRISEVSTMQAVLTKFGCIIKTRLGLHSIADNNCASSGIIILELLDNEAEMKKLSDALTAIEGVEVKNIVFEH